MSLFLFYLGGLSNFWSCCFLGMSLSLFLLFGRFVLSSFCCLWELCLIFVLLFGRFAFLIVVLFLWELIWRAHLLGGEGPPGHLPDDKAKGVHVCRLERLKTGLVQCLIQHLKWHIENWRHSKRLKANKPLEPCSALFLPWCWGRCRFRLFHCQTWWGNHAGFADLIICLSGRFDLMKCMSVRNYLTARPKSAMAQLPSRLTRMFFVLMSLKNIMIWVYLVLMLLQIHRTLLQKTIILTKRPISMTDVLSLSA